MSVNAMIVVDVLCTGICAYSLGAYIRFHYPELGVAAKKSFRRFRQTTEEGSELAGTNIAVVDRSPTSEGEPMSPTMKSSRIAASDEDKPSTAGGESMEKQASDTGAKSGSKSGSSRRQRTTTPGKPKGIFHYMRIAISFFSMWYPSWLLISYFTTYPEATAEKTCNVMTRLDNFYLISLRIAVLVFYILRLKIVMVTNTLIDKILIAVLGFAVALAFCFGILLSFYMEPYYEEGGCGILSMGTWGFIGYSTFVGISFGVHLVLFLRFIFALNIEKASLATMKASGEREKQFEGLIRKTKISFYVYSFFVITADLFYILINNAFAYEVFEGPNALKLQAILFTVMNFLFFFDATAGAISILATHSRFKEMLFCGYRKTDASVESKS